MFNGHCKRSLLLDFAIYRIRLPLIRDQCFEERIYNCRIVFLGLLRKTPLFLLRFVPITITGERPKKTFRIHLPSVSGVFLFSCSDLWFSYIVSFEKLDKLVAHQGTIPWLILALFSSPFCLTLRWYSHKKLEFDHTWEVQIKDWLQLGYDTYFRKLFLLILWCLGLYGLLSLHLDHKLL